MKIEEGQWFTWRDGNRCHIGVALKDAGFDHWWVNTFVNGKRERELKKVEELVPLCQPKLEHDDPKNYIVTLRVLDTRRDPNLRKSLELCYHIPPATILCSPKGGPFSEWTSLYVVYSPASVRMRYQGDMTTEILGKRGVAFEYLSQEAIRLWELDPTSRCK